MRILPIVLAFLLQSFCLFSNQRINFVLPQNIFIKGENISFFVKTSDDTSAKIPVIITIQSTDNNKIIQKHHIYSDSVTQLFSFSQSDNIKEGSYIINATILEMNNTDIIECHSIILHIVDKGILEKYMTFKDVKIISDKADNNFTNENKRANISYVKTQEDIIFSVDQSYFYKYQIKSTVNEGIPDTIHRLYFNTTQKSNLVAFTSKNKKPVNLIPSKIETVQSCALTDDIDHNNFFVFDIFKSIVINIDNMDLSLKHSIDDFKIMAVQDIEHINSLSEDASFVQKINYILFEEKNDTVILNTNNIVSDNAYELKNYPQFESVSLFIKEVILPVKISQKEQLELFVLSGINKKWYRNKALLMIDGKPETDHGKIKSMEWNSIESINLYRKAETLRKYYGSMGRNGVLEIITKNSKTNINIEKQVMHTQNINNKVDVEDTRPFLKPIQYIGSVKDMIHGDRIGKFSIIEFRKTDFVIKSNYEVK